MPITIGSNIASLQVQRFLGRATDGISRSFERLSSGLRINRAADDPAGLSVSASLNLNARILGRAKLNINDAVSTLSIAEGGLDQMSTLLVRMQELAEQAANGTVSRTQREYLYREYQQLDLEIRRLTKTTKFNGLSLLEGQKSNSNSQVIDNSGAALLYGLSASGRYTVYDDGVTPTLLDNETGVAQALPIPAGASSYTLAAVTNGGDVVFSAINNTSSISDLYYYSNQSGTARKLTGSLSVADIGAMALSDDGSTIAFTSATIYQDGGTASSSSAGGLNQRLYFLDVETGQIQATSTDLNSIINSVKISSDGRFAAISFGGDNGLYTGDRDSSAATVASYIPGPLTLMGVGSNGKAYFGSSGNLVGQNSALGRQIYGLDIGSQSVSQESQFTNNSAFRASRLSTDGNTVFFVSSGNYTGESPSVARQLYAFDLNTRNLEMRSAYTTGSEGAVSQNAITGTPFISADGSIVMSQDSFSLDIHRAVLRPRSTSFTFETGFGAAGGISASLTSAFDAIRGLGAYSLTSASGARATLGAIKDNLNRLNLLRGDIGAAQSRLEYAGSLTSNQQVELIAASGRISDADIAEEAAELAKRQIIQRAATSLLAQANQQPALALQLLTRR